MNVLADFEVHTDLVIVPGIDKLKYQHPVESTGITIANLQVSPGLPGLLSVQIVVEADSLKSGKERAISKLEDFLHVLTFVTNSRNEIHALRRVVDWTPGVKDRKCNQFANFSDVNLPQRGLQVELPQYHTLRASDVSEPLMSLNLQEVPVPPFPK